MKCWRTTAAKRWEKLKWPCRPGELKSTDSWPNRTIQEQPHSQSTFLLVVQSRRRMVPGTRRPLNRRRKSPQLQWTSDRALGWQKTRPQETLFDPGPQITLKDGISNNQLNSSQTYTWLFRNSRTHMQALTEIRLYSRLQWVNTRPESLSSGLSITY